MRAWQMNIVHLHSFESLFQFVCPNKLITYITTHSPPPHIPPNPTLHLYILLYVCKYFYSHSNDGEWRSSHRNICKKIHWSWRWTLLWLQVMCDHLFKFVLALINSKVVWRLFTAGNFGRNIHYHQYTRPNGKPHSQACK